MYKMANTVNEYIQELTVIIPENYEEILVKGNPAKSLSAVLEDNIQTFL